MSLPVITVTMAATVMVLSGLAILGCIHNEKSQKHTSK